MITLRTSLAFALAALLALACAPPQSPAVEPIPISWSPFYWVSAETDSARFEYTGMLQQVQLRRAGPPSVVQLDLAGSGSMPDGFPAQGREGETPAPAVSGQLHGLLAQSIRRELPGAPDSLRLTWRGGEIGTLGLPYYARSVLVLDYINRRLATLPSTANWPPLMDRSAVVVALPAGTSGQVIVPVSDPSGRRFRGLFDTGLSPFALWATPTLWEELTGLRGPGAGTRSYRVANADGALLFIGAPLRRPLQIGTWELRAPEVVYLAQGPAGASPEQWASPVDFVLGPALFAGTAVVVVDLPNRRFGISRRMGR